MSFKLTGFSDEATQNLGGQIELLKEVGWNGIELRLIDGTNVCDLDEATWESTLATLQENDIAVVGFGGQIANWARPITSDFQKDVDELRRAAPRMLQAGTKLLRVMSYPNDAENSLSDEDCKKETFRRMSELANIAEDLGVILAHENCSGYGGLGPDQYLEMVEAVNSPALKLIFDTGNNTLHDHEYGITERFYEQCKDEIIHVHIKAAKPGDDGPFVPCYPDEDPNQIKILSDLARRGYRDWISIEPHMAAVIHEGKDVEGDKGRRIWIEYAKRIDKMCEKAFAVADRA